MTELNVLTLVCLTGWAIHAAWNLVSKDRRCISVVVLLFYFFYGLPLAWDLFWGQPRYFQFPILREAAWSNQVAIAYDLFVLACPLLWWLTVPRVLSATPRTLDLSGLSRLRALFWVLLVSPVVVVAFSPNPAFYAEYGAVLGPNFTPAIERYHIAVGASCMICSAAAFSLLVSERRIWRTLCAVAPFVVLATWLVGKRNSLFLAVLLIWIALWIRGQITMSRLVLLGSATAVGLIAYSTWYQAALRPTAVLNSYRSYEIFRIDYGRDHDLRLALFCELDPDRRILRYRGESIVFDLTLFVPRAIWPQKPLNYGTYMAVTSIGTKPRFIGWGMTTSILDEAIADFSWFGMLIGPLIVALVCRIGDRSDPLAKSFSVLIACLLLTVELQAFAALVVCWVLYLAWSHSATRVRPQLRQLASLRTRRVAPGR